LLYPDENTRWTLFFLFYLDNATFDMEKGERVVGLEGEDCFDTSRERV
jgi:hypothetical protein